MSSAKNIDPKLMEDIDKILNKSFDTIRKRIVALVIKEQKKALRAGSSRKQKEPNHRHQRSSYHRSKSSSESD